MRLAQGNSLREVGVVSATRLFNPPIDIQLAARVRVPVLVTAESRYNRDMCARLIHVSSARASEPFVIFPARIEGESASADAPGPVDVAMLCQQFEQARGGTLFIDDITALTPNTQNQLHTLLDERMLPHANSNAPPARLDVRVIAGASRHLHAERASGAFCEPLFYRLNIVHVDLTDREAPRGRPREKP